MQHSMADHGMPTDCADAANNYEQVIVVIVFHQPRKLLSRTSDFNMNFQSQYDRRLYACNRENLNIVLQR